MVKNRNTFSLLSLRRSTHQHQTSTQTLYIIQIQQIFMNLTSNPWPKRVCTTNKSLLLYSGFAVIIEQHLNVTDWSYPIEIPIPDPDGKNPMPPTWLWRIKLEAAPQGRAQIKDRRRRSRVLAWGVVLGLVFELGGGQGEAMQQVNSLFGREMRTGELVRRRNGRHFVLVLRSFDGRRDGDGATHEHILQISFQLVLRYTN